MDQESDFQLELLVAMCDEGGMEFNIWCAFADIVVHGRLVGETAWHERQSQLHSRVEGMQAFAEMYAVAAQQGVNDIEFRKVIQLEKKQVTTGFLHLIEMNSERNHSGKMWRVRIADVTGWALNVPEDQNVN